MTMRMPVWYVQWCYRMNRAVWRGQVTEREATIALTVIHAAALKEAWALA